MDYLWQVIIGVLLATIVLLILSYFFDTIPTDVLWIPAYIGMVIGIFEKRNSIEYWVLPDYLEEAKSAMLSVGFNHRCTDKEETLYELKPGWRFKYFATLRKEGNKYLLEVPEKFEKQLDELITSDMLYGALHKKWYPKPQVKYAP